jgi:hypothetical protein
MSLILSSFLWMCRILPTEPARLGYVHSLVECNDGLWRSRPQTYVPHEGDILLFAKHDSVRYFLYSLAGTSSPYHSAVVIRLPDGCLGTLEAAPLDTYQVLILSLADRLRAHNGIVFVRRLKRPLCPEESAALTAFAEAQEFKGFAFGRMALALTPFRHRGEYRSKLWGTTKLDRSRWFCSELVIASEVVANRIDPETVRASSVYPRDLYLDKPIDFSGMWEKPLRWSEGADDALPPEDAMPDATDP